MTSWNGRHTTQLSGDSLVRYNALMKINVTHVAKLANLTIKDNEKEKFESQLSEVLDYVKKLDEVNTENVEPTSQVTGLENVLREDISSESLPQDRAISQAKAIHKGFIRVKGILENE